MTHTLNNFFKKIKNIFNRIGRAYTEYSTRRAEMLVAQQLLALNNGESFDYILSKVRKGQGHELLR